LPSILTRALGLGKLPLNPTSTTSKLTTLSGV
jgi:hypothetical protein